MLELGLPTVGEDDGWQPGLRSGRLLVDCGLWQSLSPSEIYMIDSTKACHLALPPALSSVGKAFTVH